MLYVQLKKEGRWKGKCMTHLQFKTQMYETLLLNWTRRNGKKLPDEIDMGELPAICIPTWRLNQRYCFVCGVQRTHFCCIACGCKPLYFKTKWCYERFHTPVCNQRAYIIGESCEPLYFVLIPSKYLYLLLQFFPLHHIKLEVQFFFPKLLIMNATICSCSISPTIYGPLFNFGLEEDHSIFKSWCKIKIGQNEELLVLLPFLSEYRGLRKDFGGG